MARSARRSPRLEVGADVAAVLRPEETARLQDLRDLDGVHCAVCGRSIQPESDTPTSVSVSLEGDRAAVEFAHGDCASSRADLAALVVHAQAEPLGIEYAQALHPQVGPVLLWERKLDLRVQGCDGRERVLYLDGDRWKGFHLALVDEPVRLLVGWLLQAEGQDLVLHHAGEEVERFHDALARAASRWLELLEESGFCLLIVGAGIGLDKPAPAAIQRAIREGRALIGMVEFDV